MHVLFDLGHPAHVHLFRNLAHALLARGDQVTVTTRDRGIVGYLLQRYGLPYTVASRPRTGKLGLALELLVHNWQVLLAALRNGRPDFLVGTSVSAAHVGLLLRRPSIVLNEDDADYVPLFTKITYPFATRVVVPSILRDRKTRRYRTHESYHELAYLHPSHFEPDPGVLRAMGLSPGEPFSVIRLVSLEAHHDEGEAGISVAQAEKLVRQLQRHGRVFVNGEAGLPESLRTFAFKAPPEHMHSVLAFARLLVSDSQTMTMEAAVLGTPAMRCNTFVGRCSVITELEEKYRLAWGYDPARFEEMLAEIERVLADPQLPAMMAERRQQMLDDKVDLTAWLLEQLDRGFP